MLIPVEKLKEWASTVEPVSGQVILRFLEEADARVKAEVEAAMKCLHDYGYKVIENPHHEYSES